MSWRDFSHFPSRAFGTLNQLDIVRVLVAQISGLEVIWKSEDSWPVLLGFIIPAILQNASLPFHFALEFLDSCPLTEMKIMPSRSCSSYGAPRVQEMKGEGARMAQGKAQCWNSAGHRAAGSPSSLPPCSSLGSVVLCYLTSIFKVAGVTMGMGVNAVFCCFWRKGQEGGLCI